MAKNFAYDPDSKTFFLKRSGDIIPGMLHEGIRRLLEFPQINEAKNLVSDFQDADLSIISSFEVRMHAKFCNEKLSHLNMVMVAPKDLMFGLGRMFQTFFKSSNVKIVRSISEALEYLGLKEMPEIIEIE